MGKGEEQRCLVDAFRFGKGFGAAFVGEQQEAGEVVFRGLDLPFEYLQSVQFGRVGAADGRRAAQAAFGDFAGAASRVVPLDDLQRRMGFQEVAALHQGDRMRAHLTHGVEPLSGQRRGDVRNAEFLLADDPRAALPQQFVVGKQTARDGVLDGGDAQQRGVAGHPGEQFAETPAGDDLYRLVPEITARRRFVETSCDALYRYSFHVGCVKIGKSRSFGSGIFVSHSSYAFRLVGSNAYGPAFSLAIKEKVMEIICKAV